MTWTPAPPLPPPWSSLGLTVPQIAAKMGIPKRTVAQWIRGDRRPRKAGRLAITLFFLARGVEPPTFDPEGL